MISILIAYAVVKLLVMLDFGDNIIQEPHQTNYFDNLHTFNSTQGFQVAFAISAYTQEEEGEQWDETYGELIARQKIWGEKDAAGKIKKTYFKDLETEPCKRKDFTLAHDAVNS